MKTLFNYIDHIPTKDQENCLSRLEEFTLKDRKQLFILRGYAGTGKTTCISALVKWSKAIGQNTVLLAPTGRAAKVMSNYSGKPAFTIHKFIYRLLDLGEQGYHFSRKENKLKNTIFIVDEASMISGELSAGESNLLDDLIDFVFENLSNQLILVGDIAQLPPVGTDLSPALVPKDMLGRYKLTIDGAELKEVVRQEHLSGILENATLIRKNIESGNKTLPEFIINNEDVFSINSNEMSEIVESVMSEYGEDGFIVITRSNKLANMYNEQLRKAVLYRENEIDAGDLIMIVRNNYYWLGSDREDFIANGDIVQVDRVTNYENIEDFKFAQASITFINSEEEKQIDAVLLLNTLSEPSSNLNKEDQKKLFNERMSFFYEEYGHKKKALLAVKSDPYYNALQIKFAYSFTCHKSQGGQWPVVFIDQSFFKDEWLDQDYLRWLYTAVTRATDKVYFVNTPQQSG
ncbi:AAA family ATPase [Salibacter sp.]|uniref:ATP-dependent DNA helicase n=1 Tax=Salibacter sp. TaxID=2010995 RepID=UPI00286FBD31|nr:AAA family ATPase [Salibacter sp.]MDR9486963.1 AAA family ATPase [Salibacter sp.]